MDIRLSYAIGLVVASAGFFAACATSDDSGGGGAAGAGGTGAKDGSTDGAGTGGTSKGGSGGSGGGQGGTGGASGAAGEAGTDSGTGGSLGDGGVSTITGRIVGLLADASGQQPPIAGMTVCIFEDTSVPCVTTDATGIYSIGPLAAGTEVMVKYTKTGYFPALVTVHTSPGTMSIADFPAPTNDEATAFAGIVGTTIDFTKGQILALSLTGSPGSFAGQDGVTATLTPMTGTGPYYLAASGFPDKTLNYTSTLGAALFANVMPGDAEVELKHYSKSCQRYSTSWVGSKADSAKVRSVAGYVTGGAVVVCP